MSTSFVANIFLKGKIECVTGLHIGGSKEKFQIGGLDNPVHRDPLTRLPYIPGSSLKGKLRMLLEYHLGVVDSESGKPSEAPAIKYLFGIGAGNGNDEGSAGTTPEESAQQNATGNDSQSTKGDSENAVKKSGPVRLIVRDAWPDATTQNRWDSLDSELLYTEYKPENTIDRISSEANPRNMERVVKGSFFDFEMILGVYKINDIQDDYSESFKHLRSAMMLLEHSTLGGSGSRGYGKIKFWLLDPVAVTQADYVAGNELFNKASEPMPDFDEANRHLFSEVSAGDIEAKVKEQINGAKT